MITFNLPVCRDLVLIYFEFMTSGETGFWYQIAYWRQLFAVYKNISSLSFLDKNKKACSTLFGGFDLAQFCFLPVLKLKYLALDRWKFSISFIVFIQLWQNEFLFQPNFIQVSQFAWRYSSYIRLSRIRRRLFQFNFMCVCEKSNFYDKYEVNTFYYNGICFCLPQNSRETASGL